MLFCGISLVSSVLYHTFFVCQNNFIFLFFLFFVGPSVHFFLKNSKKQGNKLVWPNRNLYSIPMNGAVMSGMSCTAALFYKINKALDSTIIS